MCARSYVLSTSIIGGIGGAVGKVLLPVGVTYFRVADVSGMSSLFFTPFNSQ